ncbi:tetratricopeptide repeat protein [Flavobacterium praedii]|uniref:tetratricopeptide repeat protein n=1 Tax=Flavobacterium praedii TaxID=3002900 RepID=UPI002481F121|nr:hypothetical protein [Flavobacterium praedii]
MNKIFLLSIMILFLGCKQSEAQISSKTIIKSENNDLIGSWEWSDNSKNVDVPESLFTLIIEKINGDNIIARYCAIADSGNKIDCSNDEKEFNLKGIIKNNKITATFNSFFGGKNGKVEITINGNTLSWKIVQKPNGGEYYAPDSCILTKVKEKKISEANKNTFSKFYNKIPTLTQSIAVEKLKKNKIFDNSFFNYKYDKDYFTIDAFNVVGKFEINNNKFIIYNFTLVGEGEGFQEDVFLVNAYTYDGKYLDNLILKGNIGGEGGSNSYENSKIENNNFTINVKESFFESSTGLNYVVSVNNKINKYRFDDKFILYEEKYDCLNLDFNNYFESIKKSFDEKKPNIIVSDCAVKLKSYMYCYPLSNITITKYNDIAYYLEQARAYKESIFLLKEILSKYPDRVVAYLNLGDAQWGFDQNEKAKTSYQKYVELMKTQGKDLNKIPKRVYDRIK